MLSKWNNMENHDYEGTVFEDHLFSYRDLPPHLQRCFAFCSIFPNKWRFEREKLTKMWMALGFVETPPKGVTMEDKARGYFDALVQRSLFEEEEGGGGGGGDSSRVAEGESTHATSRYYVIHDQIHSMIRKVCPDYYLSIDSSGGTKSIPVTARHLSVTTDCLGHLKASIGLKKLRTLLVFGKDGDTAIEKGVLGKFKSLRVLDVADTCFSEVPEGITELKHLRYLGLPNTITDLGAGVTNLLLLQTLGIVSKDCRLERLPQDMSHLINLRHLDVGMEYIAQIAGIGSMTNLQESLEFHAGRKPHGHDLSELQKLYSLNRKLSIKGLETVRDKKAGQSAHLENKAHVKTLELQWSDGGYNTKRAASDHLDVVEGLRPHENLDSLQIGGYAGKKLPSWLEDAGLMMKLRFLYLSNCSNLEGLPLVGSLSHLEHLHLRGLRSVRRIGDDFCRSGGFASLQVMVLQDMGALETWDSNDGSKDGKISSTPPILFPRLNKVMIVNCRSLSSLSGLLYCRLSLTYLHVERCPRVTANFQKSMFPRLKPPRPERLFVGTPPRDAPRHPKQAWDDPPPHPSPYPSQEENFPAWVCFLLVLIIFAFGYDSVYPKK